MKKISSIVIALGTILLVTACGNNNDDPIDRTLPRTWKGQLLNHVVNTANGQVERPTMGDFQFEYSLSKNMNTLTFTPTLSVIAGGGSETNFTWAEIKAHNSETAKEAYTFVITEGDNDTTVTGSINPFEQIIRLNYTLNHIYKVIATNNVLTSIDNNTTETFADTVGNTQSVVYNVDINPTSMTAKITIGNYTDIKHSRKYEHLVMNKAKVEATPKGYNILADQIIAEDPQRLDKDGNPQKHNVTGLKFFIDLETNKISAVLNFEGAAISMAGKLHF